jgi:hypothetical protein
MPANPNANDYHSAKSYPQVIHRGQKVIHSLSTAAALLRQCKSGKVGNFEVPRAPII